MHAATSKVENSAKGLSCKLKFVHGGTLRVWACRREGMLYACKGAPGSAKAGLVFPGESYGCTHRSERERDKEIKIKRERKRKMMAALKGMTGALAPFSYLG